MAQRLSCRLYAVMSNQRGMAQLLSLWNNWVANPHKRATTGFGPFKDVFIHLKDIRRWSPQDRLERTGVLDYWQQYLQQKQGPIKFEVELWCRGSGEVRQRAYDNLQSLVGETSRKCVRETQIPEICYHGVLAELPPQSLHETINHILQNEYSQLLRCEDVMFFRPFGQSGFPVEEADDPPPGAPPPAKGPDTAVAAEPVVALLDGLPLENHVLLAGRLIVDDPDDCRFASSVMAKSIRNGRWSPLSSGQPSSDGGG